MDTPPEQGKGRERGSRVRRFLKWLVSLALVGLLLLLVDVRGAIAAVASAQPIWLVAAVLLGLGDRLFMVVKWVPLLRVQIPGISLMEATKAYLASSFAEHFLPASVGADVARAVGVGLGRDEGVVRTGTSIVMERLLGLIGLSALIVVALLTVATSHPELGRLAPWVLGFGGAIALVVVLPLVLEARSLGRWITRLSSRRFLGWLAKAKSAARAYRSYSGHPGLLAGVGILSFIEQLVPIAVLYLLSRSLGAGVGFEALLLAVPISTFVSRLPISVGGLGVVEGSLVFLLGFFGVPGSEALAIALLGRVVIILSTLPGALFWSELARSNEESKRSDTVGGHADAGPVTPPLNRGSG